MRTWKLRIVLGILFLAVIGGGAWLVFRPEELHYHGKDLSAWIEQYLGSPDGGKEERQAEQAILEIGTNALPTYVKWLGERDSATQEKAIALLRRQSLFTIPWHTTGEHRVMARIALGVLGDRAAPVVPALIDMLANNKDTGVQAEVVMSLGRIGPSAADAVPALIDCLKGTNRFAKFSIPNALVGIQKRAELSVPALIQFLGDSKKRPSDVCRAINALGDFGDKAILAVPTLLPLLNDPDGDVRAATTNALQAIDPEAAAKAGVK